MHGDLNACKILVLPATQDPDAYEVAGFLDFGGMAVGYLVFDTAILMVHMMLHRTAQDPVATGGHALAGFESVLPLHDAERDALFLLVCSRFAQLLLMAHGATQANPEHYDYVMAGHNEQRTLSRELYAAGKGKTTDCWTTTQKATCHGGCQPPPHYPKPHTYEHSLGQG